MKKIRHFKRSRELVRETAIRIPRFISREGFPSTMLSLFRIRTTILMGDCLYNRVHRILTTKLPDAKAKAELAAKAKASKGPLNTGTQGIKKSGKK
jgi:hypothetical protein